MSTPPNLLTARSKTADSAAQDVTSVGWKMAWGFVGVRSVEYVEISSEASGRRVRSARMTEQLEERRRRVKERLIPDRWLDGMLAGE